MKRLEWHYARTLQGHLLARGKNIFKERWKLAWNASTWVLLTAGSMLEGQRRRSPSHRISDRFLELTSCLHDNSKNTGAIRFSSKCFVGTLGTFGQHYFAFRCYSSTRSMRREISLIALLTRVCGLARSRNLLRYAISEAAADWQT